MLIADKNNFYEIVESFFTTLPDQLTSVTEECFRNVYGSAAASNCKNIVYILRCAKKFGRLNGESDILYIGQTKHSFSARYYPYARLHVTSEANRLKFQHIIENHAPIRVSICDYSIFGETLLQAEGQLLWWYFQNHCEYPPINYSKTRNRNSMIQMAPQAEPGEGA